VPGAGGNSRQPSVCGCPAFRERSFLEPSRAGSGLLARRHFINLGKFTGTGAAVELINGFLGEILPSGDVDRLEPASFAPAPGRAGGDADLFQPTGQADDNAPGRFVVCGPGNAGSMRVGQRPPARLCKAPWSQPSPICGVADRTASPPGEGLKSYADTSAGKTMVYDKSDTRPVIPAVVQAMLSKYGSLVNARSGAVRLVRA
jgi:hypothetical protein